MASAATPAVASRIQGRWEVALADRAAAVMVDGQPRQVVSGRVALDKLAIGTHTLDVNTNPPLILLVRESGTTPVNAVPTATREFDATVDDPKLRQPAPTIRVMQGDIVQLDVLSATPVDVHLHGYDILGKVGPNKPLSIAFDANLAGRFSFETHGETHNSFAYLEVLPR